MIKVRAAVISGGPIQSARLNEAHLNMLWFN